jgi:hypothetical protein
MVKPVAKTCSEHAIHVDRNEAADRWDILSQDGMVVGHCHTQREAVDLAIHEAQQTHSRGGDVVVCVEQVDGHYTMAWSST